MSILIVDDDVVSRMVLMHLVDSCGSFEILEAEDGQDAWSQLERGLRPALCFCDLRMPRLSGMELLGRVRGDPALRAMPFILVSSAAERETVEQAGALGASGYIVKPFKVEDVRVHVGIAGGAGHRCEAPQATMQRLGIDCARLLAYLGGLRRQLAAATTCIGRPGAAAQAELERLEAGCGTLGLTGAAAALKACCEGVPDAEQANAALADALSAVMHQSELVERMLGPR